MAGRVGAPRWANGARPIGVAPRRRERRHSFRAPDGEGGSRIFRANGRASLGGPGCRGRRSRTRKRKERPGVGTAELPVATVPKEIPMSVLLADPWFNEMIDGTVAEHGHAFTRRQVE